MCYADRSLEQATATCAMCKVFPPRNDFLCSHKDNMGVCKNRVNHPRHDVVYFRNAELTAFNGCGYCKWAKRNPKILNGDAAWKNPGWPGCCRPPKSNEHDFINPADWYAISKIHNVSIPALSGSGTSPTSSHTSPNKSPSHSPPSRSKTIAPRTPERRNSGSRDRTSAVARDNSTTSIVLSSRVDQEGRQRSSSDTPRKADASAPVRAPVVTRESTIAVQRTSPRTPNSGPPREADRPRSSQDDKDREKERKTANKINNADNAFSTIRGPPSNVVSPPPPASQPPPPPHNTTTVPKSSVSSSCSSSSSGSVTQSGTVTSEGFTDYLSDESEIEMQKEAERRAVQAEIAAKLERTRLELGKEEQEFRAARIQLASVGLQPPPAWSSGKTVHNSKTIDNPVIHSYTSPRSSRSPTSLYNTAVSSAPMIPVSAARQ